MFGCMGWPLAKTAQAYPSFHQLEYSLPFHKPGHGMRQHATNVVQRKHGINEGVMHIIHGISLLNERYAVRQGNTESPA